MDIKVEEIHETNQNPNLNQPLLQNPPKTQKTKTQKAMRRTFKGTARLANLLPTGSVLTFQILSPIFTHTGECKTVTNQKLTAVLLFFCGVSCFVLRFTDSVKDPRGKMRYGIATFDGLWVIDGSFKVPVDEADKYKLKFVDFLHAFLSFMVFVAVALFDQNVVRCFCPEPSEDVKEILTGLPVAIGVVCSFIFLVFPTTRHGIGAAGPVVSK